jgi:hypothetical protein
MKQSVLNIMSVCIPSFVNQRTNNNSALNYSVICGLSGCTTFLNIIKKTAEFWKKVTEHKMCVLISSTTVV